MKYQVSILCWSFRKYIHFCYFFLFVKIQENFCQVQKKYLIEENLVSLFLITFFWIEKILNRLYLYQYFFDAILIIIPWGLTCRYFLSSLLKNHILFLIEIHKYLKNSNKRLFEAVDIIRWVCIFYCARFSKFRSIKYFFNSMC